MLRNVNIFIVLLLVAFFFNGCFSTPDPKRFIEDDQGNLIELPDNKPESKPKSDKGLPRVKAGFSIYYAL